MARRSTADNGGIKLNPIKKKRLRDLVPADYNPREMTDEERAGLRASLLEFGRVDVITWNQRSGRVVGGHQRLELLLADGVEEDEVVIVDLDDPHERALNLTLNNRHIGGHFTEAAAPMIEELRVTVPEIVVDVRLDALAIDLGAPGTGPGPGGNDEPGGDPGEGRYKEQYGVIVLCTDEAEQERVYNDLKGRGLQCRVVTT